MGRTSKHGHAVRGAMSGAYVSWRAMKQRCLYRKSRFWEYYGGRGITIHTRWMEFENFLADMGERPAGKTLDRFPDPSGNYEPGNCRWASRSEQALNKRGLTSIGFKGQSKTIQEWSRELGISGHAIRYRLGVGMTVEEALTFPSNSFYRRKAKEKVCQPQL